MNENKDTQDNMNENKNENPASSAVKAYAIFSQGIFTMITLGVIGFFIGYKIDKKSALQGVLAVIGCLIGLVYFICLVYKNHYFDNIPKKKDEGDDGEKQ